MNETLENGKWLEPELRKQLDKDLKFLRTLGYVFIEHSEESFQYQGYYVIEIERDEYQNDLAHELTNSNIPYIGVEQVKDGTNLKFYRTKFLTDKDLKSAITLLEINCGWYKATRSSDILLTKEHNFAGKIHSFDRMHSPIEGYGIIHNLAERLRGIHGIEPDEETGLVAQNILTESKMKMNDRLRKAVSFLSNAGIKLQWSTFFETLTYSGSYEIHSGSTDVHFAIRKIHDKLNIIPVIDDSGMGNIFYLSAKDANLVFNAVTKEFNGERIDDETESQATLRFGPIDLPIKLFERPANNVVFNDDWQVYALVDKVKAKLSIDNKEENGMIVTDMLSEHAPDYEFSDKEKLKMEEAEKAVKFLKSFGIEIVGDTPVSSSWNFYLIGVYSIGFAPDAWKDSYLEMAGPYLDYINNNIWFYDSEQLALFLMKLRTTMDFGWEPDGYTIVYNGKKIAETYSSKNSLVGLVAPRLVAFAKRLQAHLNIDDDHKEGIMAVDSLSEGLIDWDEFNKSCKFLAGLLPEFRKSNDTVYWKGRYQIRTDAKYFFDALMQSIAEQDIPAYPNEPKWDPILVAGKCFQRFYFLSKADLIRAYKYAIKVSKQTLEYKIGGAWGYHFENSEGDTVGLIEIDQDEEMTIYSPTETTKFVKQIKSKLRIADDDSEGIETIGQILEAKADAKMIQKANYAIAFLNGLGINIQPTEGSNSNSKTYGYNVPYFALEFEVDAEGFDRERILGFSDEWITWDGQENYLYFPTKYALERAVNLLLINYDLYLDDETNGIYDGITLVGQHSENIAQVHIRPTIKIFISHAEVIEYADKMEKKHDIDWEERLGMEDTNLLTEEDDYPEGEAYPVQITKISDARKAMEDLNFLISCGFKFEQVGSTHWAADGSFYLKLRITETYNGLLEQAKKLGYFVLFTKPDDKSIYFASLTQLFNFIKSSGCMLGTDASISSMNYCNIMDARGYVIGSAHSYVHSTVVFDLIDIIEIAKRYREFQNIIPDEESGIMNTSLLTEDKASDRSMNLLNSLGIKIEKSGDWDTGYYYTGGRYSIQCMTKEWFDQVKIMADTSKIFWFQQGKDPDYHDKIMFLNQKDMLQVLVLNMHCGLKEPKVSEDPSKLYAYAGERKDILVGELEILTTAQLWFFPAELCAVADKYREFIGIGDDETQGILATHDLFEKIEDYPLPIASDLLFLKEKGIILIPAQGTDPQLNVNGTFEFVGQYIITTESPRRFKLIMKEVEKLNIIYLKTFNKEMENTVWFLNEEDLRKVMLELKLFFNVDWTKKLNQNGSYGKVYDEYTIVTQNNDLFAMGESSFGCFVRIYGQGGLHAFADRVRKHYGIDTTEEEGLRIGHNLLENENLKITDDLQFLRLHGIVLTKVENGAEGVSKPAEFRYEDGSNKITTRYDSIRDDIYEVAKRLKILILKKVYTNGYYSIWFQSDEDLLRILEDMVIRDEIVVKSVDMPEGEDETMMGDSMWSTSKPQKHLGEVLREPMDNVYFYHQQIEDLIKSVKELNNTSDDEYSGMRAEDIISEGFPLFSDLPSLA